MDLTKLTLDQSFIKIVQKTHAGPDKKLTFDQVDAGDIIDGDQFKQGIIKELEAKGFLIIYMDQFEVTKDGYENYELLKKRSDIQNKG